MLAKMYGRMLSWSPKFYTARIITAVEESNVPTNLRQYYADRLMLLHLEIALGL